MIMKNLFDHAASCPRVPVPARVPVPTVTTRHRGQRHWPMRGEVRRSITGYSDAGRNRGRAG